MNSTIFLILSIISGVVFIGSIIAMIAIKDIIIKDYAEMVMYIGLICCAVFLMGWYTTNTLEELAAIVHKGQCENCGSVISGAYEYCPECGEPYSRDTCDYCMSAIDKNQKFCGECGKQISE